MKRFLLISMFLIFSIAFVHSFESVATTDNALSTIVNPAGLGFNRTFEGFLISPFDTFGAVNETQLFFRAGGIGFSSQFSGENNYNAFTISTGTSIGKNMYLGSGYRWFTKTRRGSEWNLGFLYRPFNFLSIGVTAKNINYPDELFPRYNLGFAIRPFGNRFTVSLDGAYYKTETADYGEDLNLTVGAQLELINGIAISGHYSEDNFGIGLGLNLRNFGIEGYSNFNDEGNFATGQTVTHFSIDRYRTILKSKKKYWVTLTLAGQIIEERRPSGIFGKNSPTLKNILDVIERIATDPEAKGIYLIMEGPECGFAKMQEIRQALSEVRRKGKLIYCYAQMLNNRDYYLATVADSLFMNPSGELNLTGLASEVPFFKGMLDKIGIEAELEHIGKYKSASDIFTQDSMTPAHKEVTNAILDDLFDQLTRTIAQARGMNIQSLKQLIDQGPFSAKQAKDHNLIDRLLYEDEVGERLRKGQTKAVSLKKYISSKNYVYDWQTKPQDKIAIIYATGNIVSGRSGKNFLAGNLMGSKTIVSAIRSARKDRSIKAIILRIDSGGGSGLASDVIWREVKKATEGKNTKPFVVSMSDVAGSGGYYIACAADIIVADEGTITGSIGVVSGKFSFEKFYKKIGLRFEENKRGKHAAMFSTTKSFTDDERKKLKIDIREFYRDFIEKVAEGRDIPVAQVDSIGRGRIWTGNQAKQIGLIDEIGGLSDAIKIAKRKAGISEEKQVGLEIYPKYNFFNLLNLFDSKTSSLESILPCDIHEVLTDIGKYKIFENENILYIMPYTVTIK